MWHGIINAEDWYTLEILIFASLYTRYEETEPHGLKQESQPA